MIFLLWQIIKHFITHAKRNVNVIHIFFFGCLWGWLEKWESGEIQRAMTSIRGCAFPKSFSPRVESLGVCVCNFSMIERVGGQEKIHCSHPPQIPPLRLAVSLPPRHSMNL